MAKLTFRGNCTASYFPMISQNYGQSMQFRSTNDTDYIISNGFTGSMADAFIGIPIPIYLHNCLPTSAGMQSVGYKEVFPKLGNSPKSFDRAIPIPATSGVFVPAQGSNYINEGFGWVAKPFQYGAAGMITSANVQGKTYICYQGNGIYELPSMAPLQLKGINPASLKGICGLGAFLIAYDDDTIYWSSPADVTDFIPSLESSAGSESVLAVRSEITCVLPYAEGAVVYTKTNAVAMIYSNNLRQPWIYREIKGSAGVLSPEHVSHEANADGHYAWTTSGLQLIRIAGAEPIYPEVSDFLNQKILEDWIGETGLYPGINTSALDTHVELPKHNFAVGPNMILVQHLESMKVKVSLVGKRFIAISYGEFSLTHILVYDVGLRRWGKLRIPHTDVFQHGHNDAFCVLQHTGRVLTLDYSNRAKIEEDDAVVIWGRIQLQRGVGSYILDVSLSNTYPGATKLKTVSSPDGRMMVPAVEPVMTYSGDTQMTWQGREYGVSHHLVIQGNFHLNTIEVTMDALGGSFR